MQSPEEVVNTFVEGWNAGDAKKLASIFVEDAEFVNVTGLWWHNKERIYQAHEYGLRVIFKGAQLKITRQKTRWLSKDIALVHAKMKLTGQTPFGKAEKTNTKNNMLLFVCKHQNGSWMCETVQNTEILSGQEIFIVNESGERTAVNYGQFGK